MKLNLEEMREIARTLPIGYYLGRKVPVFVEDGNLAYCDVVKGDVHIGVGLLQTAADHIDATDAAEWDRETLLRCLLYHEIGHLLLTPKWYKVLRVKNANGNSYREDKSNAILNIFEDERLERILSKYFMGVKFRKFVKLVCKGEGGGRRDDISKIYRAIRLRDAPKDVSDAVDAAIKNLAHIISVTNEWGYDSAGEYVYNLGRYSEVVNDLVAKILDSKEESGGGQSQQSQGQSQAQSQSQGQGRSKQEQSKQDKPEQPAPKEQSEHEKPDGEQKDEQKDGKSDGESDDKPDADDKSDAEDDSKAEENSGGDGDGDDGSDGESDKPDEEDSEGDDGEGDADGDGDADADGEESDGNGEQGDGDESDEDSDGDAKDDGDDSDDADDAGDDDSDGGVDGDDGDDESSDGDATGDDADASDTEDAEDTDGEASCAVSGVLELPPEYLKDVADKVFATPTSDIENVLRRFAQRIAKQKGAQAAGRWSALTGRIDPRRDAQDKDRIFRRSSDVGDAINTAVHLTLWVDTSGSFCRSVPLLNQILAATYRAMKMSGGRLDVDVVKMNYGAEVAGQNDWQIVAHGGNNLNSSYVNAWRKTRRKNKRNIDVVVFDGEACEYNGNAKAYIDEIVKQIWDSPDCHLVVDHTNGDWASNLKRAHVTLLTGNYAESLRDEVVKLLDRIL